MRIPFSWRLERERKIPSKGQRHSAPLCSDVQASFGACLKHCLRRAGPHVQCGRSDNHRGLARRMPCKRCRDNRQGRVLVGTFPICRTYRDLIRDVPKHADSSSSPNLQPATLISMSGSSARKHTVKPIARRQVPRPVSRHGSLAFRIEQSSQSPYLARPSPQQHARRIRARETQWDLRGSGAGHRWRIA